MEKNIANYMRKHTMTVVMIVLIGFFLVAIGQYLLYRNQMKLNKMISEGLMQLKEEKKLESVDIKGDVIKKDGTKIILKEGELLDLK